MIPIIDLFAGPGGLGEGFSSLLNNQGERIFKIKLSIEKDINACQTLKLRSFFRQFPINNVPEDYYDFVKGHITLDELYRRYPDEATAANTEAWCGTLGEPEKNDTNGLSNDEIDHRISEALDGNRNWVLIGGPPCQAYSIVGRARRQEKTLDEKKDKRVGLYKEYLRIIAMHRPAVFVMENVKGLLSAQTKQEFIFTKIHADLSDPIAACTAEGAKININERLHYRIFSLAVKPEQFTPNHNPIFKPEDFIIKAEEYGVPQKRHRVILLGIRDDVNDPQTILQKQTQVPLASVINNLPALRSGISREYSHSALVPDKDGNLKKKLYYNKIKDSSSIWRKYILNYNQKINQFLNDDFILADTQLPDFMGGNFIKTDNSLPENHPLRNWYYDARLNGILHHESRKHMAQDLLRYVFAARYARHIGTSPKLEDYKMASANLLPNHENAESGKFTDRFRVQLPNTPATTVTSHIAKDGHYFIHYDPKQARSLTVREAARIQTFPDNYYFYGGRTEQFHQVGNAVPPYLAYQIAQVVNKIFTELIMKN